MRSATRSNFFLTGGAAPDLVGADHLLPSMQADTLIEPTKRSMPTSGSSRRWLRPAETAVIPPEQSRRLPRDYNDTFYQARRLIENFFAQTRAGSRCHRHPLRQDRAQLPAPPST